MKTILEERREILNNMLNYVSEYFGIDRNLILISNAEEYVNSRYLIIKILCDNYSDKDVSAVTGLTKSGVNSIKNKFADKKMLQDLYLKLKQSFINYF